jgi:hypothetical protein
MLHETWASYECDGREMDHTHKTAKVIKKSFTSQKAVPAILE